MASENEKKMAQITAARCHAGLKAAIAQKVDAARCGEMETHQRAKNLGLIGSRDGDV